MMTDVFEAQKKMIEQWKTMFKTEMPVFDPMEMMKMAFSSTDDKKKLFDNYLKYHQAYIDYHAAIKSMTEAMNENADILTKIMK